MQEDYTIHLLNMSHLPQFDKSQQFVQYTNVSIMVGRFGPFSARFGPGEDSPEQIKQWQQRKQAEVMSLNNGG